MSDHDRQREEMKKRRRLQGRCENGETENMAEERRWEDLDMDCLVNVFGRLDVESLFSDVPFVCKSWHKATHDPSCWRYLVFPNDWFSFADKLSVRGICQHERFSIKRFIQLIIIRSCKNATTLSIPGSCIAEAFKFAVDGSPALRVLRLAKSQLIDESLNFMEVFGKWKSLEDIEVRPYRLLPILTAIGLNCKNLKSLRVIWAMIYEEEALAIVNLLPNIKHLYLRTVWISWENLARILKGCEELVTLDISDCRSSEIGEEILVTEEIQNLASRIHTFMF